MPRVPASLGACIVEFLSKWGTLVIAGDGRLHRFSGEALVDEVARRLERSYGERVAFWQAQDVARRAQDVQLRAQDAALRSPARSHAVA